MKTNSSYIYSKFHSMDRPETRTVINVTLELDRETILDLLQSESILIHGENYEIPERKLEELLFLRKYGKINVDLTKLKDK